AICFHASCIFSDTGAPLTYALPYTTLFRSAIQLVGYHSTRTGDAVTAEMPTGEVVATVASDALRVGEVFAVAARFVGGIIAYGRSEEHTSELQSRENLVCRLLLEKKKLTTR